jgi:hypothetical protein
VSASASAIHVGELEECRSAKPRRGELERAARRLPESDLKAAILATLADREPTPREALAWAALLQLQHSRVG